MTGVMRKPAFWGAYAIAALAALFIAVRLFPLAIALLAGCVFEPLSGWRAHPDCTCTAADGGSVQVAIIDFVECEVPREQVVGRCDRWIDPPPTHAACVTPVTCSCTVAAADSDCND